MQMSWKDTAPPIVAVSVLRPSDPTQVVIDGLVQKLLTRLSTIPFNSTAGVHAAPWKLCLQSLDAQIMLCHSAYDLSGSGLHAFAMHSLHCPHSSAPPCSAADAGPATVQPSATAGSCPSGCGCQACRTGHLCEPSACLLCTVECGTKHHFSSNMLESCTHGVRAASASALLHAIRARPLQCTTRRASPDPSCTSKESLGCCQGIAQRFCSWCPSLRHQPPLA